MSQDHPTLRDALAALAGRCDWANARDGAGYSAADAAIGHSLADRDERYWSPKQQEVARKLVVKYRGQLSSYGFDVDGLLAAPPVAPATNGHKGHAPLIAKAQGQQPC